MIRVTLGVLLSINLIGCAKFDLKAPVALRGYIASFEAKLGAPIENMTYSFGDLNGNVVGQCRYWPSEDRGEIIFDIEHWDNISPAEREQLVYHELGHCVLQRGHRIDKIEGRPVSVMYPSVLDEDTYVDNHQDYITELFTVKTPTFKLVDVKSTEPTVFTCD